MPRMKNDLLDIAYNLSKDGATLEKIAGILGRSRTQTKQYVFWGAWRQTERQKPDSLVFLGLDPTTTRRLQSHLQIDTIPELLSLIETEPLRLYKIRRIGTKTIADILNACIAYRMERMR